MSTSTGHIFKENRLVDEALEMIVAKWNEVMRAAGAQWPGHVTELLTAATLAACKIQFMFLGPDVECYEGNEVKWNYLNDDTDIHAKRFHAKVELELGAQPTKFAWLKNGKDGTPYWFAGDDLIAWGNGGNGANIQLIKDMAMRMEMNLVGMRGENPDEGDWIVPHMMALVAASKLLLLGHSAEQAEAIERTANQAAYEITAAISSRFGKN